MTITTLKQAKDAAENLRNFLDDFSCLDNHSDGEIDDMRIIEDVLDDAHASSQTNLEDMQQILDEEQQDAEDTKKVDEETKT